MFDGMFDLPELTMLQVHRLTLYAVGDVVESYESDADGNPIDMVFEGGRDLMGYVTAWRPSRRGSTQRADVVIRGLSPMERVSPGDWIVVPEQPNLMPSLAGRYQIGEDGIRPNPADLRLLLSRPLNPAQRDRVDSNPYTDELEG